MIIAVLYATFAVAKRKPEKDSGLYSGFDPLTSAIPVQRSTNYANKPTGNRSLKWYAAVHIYDCHIFLTFNKRYDRL